jgi:hypothetical protein
VAEAAAGRFADLLLPAARGLPELPEVVVTQDMAEGVRHGIAFPSSVLGKGVPDHGPVRITDAAGGLLAIYDVDGPRARPEVVLG